MQQTQSQSQITQEMRQCIQNCQDCHAICLETMTHCLQMGGRHAEPDHISLMADCIEICQTSANFMLRRSQMHHKTCGVCAEVCRRCADDCDRVDPVDAMMQRCAEMCRRCAESCAKMSQHPM